MDAVYGLDFERLQHPYYEKQGKVQALETIKFAISTHRGCYGSVIFVRLLSTKAELFAGEARILSYLKPGG